MGGERETLAEQRSQKSDKTGKVETVGRVRFHESAGEIHFHDDKNKLKVAVPTGVWSNAWAALSSGQRDKFKFVDVKNKSRLSVSVRSSGGHFEALIRIKPAAFSDEFASLQKFTQS